MLGIALGKIITNRRQRTIGVQTNYAGGASSVNDATVGTINWTNVGNVLVSDNTYSTVASAGTTKYVYVSSFGFSIPTTAKIKGILAEIERKTSGVAGTTDNSIKLFKAGVVSGSDKSVGAAWSTSEGFVTYGGSTDLWGTTWTPAQINSSTFGVGFSAVVGSITSASIDFIRLKIYYEI